MGSLYFQEPPTSGKIILNTTVGNIDIELWPKETPKACRNFVQLCLEGYYDGTMFHRMVKGFIVQGGDPKGDGTGGESIYGKPFRDEFHSRLRFVRRGLLAMANGGPNDNASQFFFTLGACPELQNKNTVFGKVSGDSLYNMLKLEEGLVDENDRVLYPHKIISTTVVVNPFPDIVPRKRIEKIEVKALETKPKEKNYKLLSFGEEAEDEENEILASAIKVKSKSSHDLIDDPKLSSVSAAMLYENNEGNNTDSLETVRKKLKVSKESTQKLEVNKTLDQELSVDDKVKESSSIEREEIRKEIESLKKELRKSKTVPEHKDENTELNKEKESQKTHNPWLEEHNKQAKVYKTKSKLIPTDNAERQKQTMALLAKFESKIKTVKETKSESADEDNSEDSWLAHSFTCNDDLAVAKDANLRSEDWYDITDPRNPMNQRRRLEKK